MGIVEKFERTLQGAVGDAFARLFGGRVVATEIESSLRRQAESSVRSVDGHRLASNSYTVTLARTDYDTFTEDEALAVKTFSKHLGDYISEQGWETYGPVTVSFAMRDDLHTGQLRVAGSVDPDAVPFQVASAAPAPSPEQRYPAAPHSFDQAAPARPAYPSPSAAPTTIAPAAGTAAPAATTDRTVTLYLEDGSGRTFTLQRGSNLLGRGQDAAFRLPDTGVSRQHADIHFDGRDAVLSDLGSTNGTSVNGGPVQDWHLADGDRITVGHSEILVRVD